MRLPAIRRAILFASAVAHKNYHFRSAILLLVVLTCSTFPVLAEPTAVAETQNTAGYDVETYNVQGGPRISMDVVFPVLANYTGTNVSLEKIAEAAQALQTEYQKEGYTNTSVAIARNRITNGIVTLTIFQAALPQVVVSGVRYLGPTHTLELPAYSPPVEAPHPATVVAATNAPPPINYRPKPATPAEMAADRAALLKKMAEVEVEEKDHRIHVVSTNTGARFEVEHYLVLGNSILTPEILGAAITNIDGAFGTNVSFDGVQTVVDQLESAYHNRGYATVAVRVPQQSLSNATVKLQILEGRLSSIKVVGNEYFSSNNVMRALPSLRNGIIINAPVLQAELNNANANQDRQITPIVGPGPEPGTSDLTLKVKDRLPLHGKVEVNNENSPGTPDLRINSSAVYNNLWQLEQSIGFQYGFSPELDKPGKDWAYYDRPVVANYSGFYRLPLGGPQSLSDEIGANPGTFGYNEATHKFNLPPASGQPDLTFFASRSTDDSGLTTTLSGMVTTNGSNPSIFRQDVEQSPTVNEDMGARLSYPLPAASGFQSTLSGGLDFKVYRVANAKTNIFFFTQVNDNAQGAPVSTNTTADLSAIPLTDQRLEYLPLSLRYDARWHDALGNTSFGLGLNVNLWDSGVVIISSPTYVTNSGVITTNPYVYLHGAKAVQNITGSSQSSGHWVVLTPSFSRDINIDNWTTLFRLDGQWASEPLISSEQFGAGGVNSVRGYHEGEVFGDDGWHVSLDQETPPWVVGTIRDNTPLTLRASIYTDYAEVYLIDPQGRPDMTPLWGTGLGLTVAGGSHWQGQWLFSVPLINTPTTQKDQFYFNFSLTAQF